VDTKVCAISYNFCSFELSLAIYKDSSGYDEPVYDTLQKLDRYFLCDVYHWHSIQPLGECVDYDK
jgi:hypothetical protein